jgi:nucleoid-associated protein YgaU|tara:strand:- start:6303 stop:6641 length:339 start_codon:yes stop_codon:yes gene_type:complete
MPSRYSKIRKIFNNTEYYEPLRKSRDLKEIEQYATFPLHNPTISQRAAVLSNSHIWKYGDRLYNLAHQYYGDTRYWWVIAWWNGYCMESQISTGAAIYIPLNLEEVLPALGV